MSKFCCGVRACYIPGASCMLKANTLPQAGYANGSQGRMIGVVHEDSNYVLPRGYSGEMIMIPPPRFIIMEVHHKGKNSKTSILPCEKLETELKYYRNGKEQVYRCWSNNVVLTFALTVHETQGQTLRRIILLLGRLPGMNVGRITWSLLYVALSRTRRLSHIIFFPTGSTRYYHSMYFSHLLRLKMPANLKKWHRSYVDHTWDRNVLRNEHLQSVRKVERKLKALGEDKTMRLKWNELRSFLKEMGYKTTTRDRKRMLFCKLKEHMVKRSLWKNSQDFALAHKGCNQNKKRKLHEVEVQSFQKSKTHSRPSKRSRKRKQSKSDYEQQSRRSEKNDLSCVQVTSKHRVKNSRRRKRKCLDRRRDRVSRNLKPRTSRSNLVSGSHTVSHEFNALGCKGLKNLGNSCFFNAIIQCLFHCPTFTAGIKNLSPEALTVNVLSHMRILLRDITSVHSLPYITPTKCLTAVMNIAECQSAGIVKGVQQDASEFLGHLLEHFYQKFRPLSDIFEGQFISIHTCQLCSHSYSTNQPFKQYTLQMDLPSAHETQTLHLYKLMDHYHQSGIIEGYTCTHCHSENSTNKKISIIALPRILVVHLSRFRGLAKINNYVRFPEHALIKYKIDNNEYKKQYRVNGIVVHIGPSIAQGHYVSYTRVGDNWIKANDETVTLIRFESVRRRKVYLLFYEEM